MVLPISTLPLIRPLLAALLLLMVAWAPALGQSAEYVLDNTDASTVVRGNWQTTVTTTGFMGADYRFRTAGDGTSTFSWPFPANAPFGRYEVFVRWTSGPNRATNAPYRVNHAAGSADVTRSQREGGGTWQPIGAFEFAPGKGQGVLLSDRADGVVVADAIRWVPVAAAQPAISAPQQAATPAARPPSASATPTAKPSATATPLAGQAAAAVQPVVGASPTAQPQATAAPTAAPTSTPVAPAPSPTPTPDPKDPRYFAQTRFRIAEDAMWDYFQKRGGVRTFGYPISNTFTLLGMKVQIFQRQVMQLRPDGGVQTMNMLDDGLMPYTRANGSTFPGLDPEVTGRAPSPDEPNYHERALQFVRDMAPDEFDGQKVNFGRTFFSSVRTQDAFPSGAPEDADGLLDGFNLEIWGLPTSRPFYEPTNRNFIYQRFQRGIMHYDKSCDCTQGLLLGEYLKAIMTNRDLPGDLAEQAKTSRLFAQWSPRQPTALARPGDLPLSNWTGAFPRDPMLTVDAGHGGREIGAAQTFADGTVLQEKAMNLRVATRLRELLEGAGYQVTMTRTTDAPVNNDNKDRTGDGKVNVSDDLQARVDIANAARSDLFISVHFNGVSDPNTKGTYTFWGTERPFSDRNKALAELVQASMLKALRDAGYNTLDKGARTDQSVLAGGHYYLLGPRSDVIARPSEMPALIGEPLFLSNLDDATALRNDRIVEAVARGYLEGIRAYFQRYPAE